eukprot:1082157-Rhodomonas_salina.1
MTGGRIPERDAGSVGLVLSAAVLGALQPRRRYSSQHLLPSVGVGVGAFGAFSVKGQVPGWAYVMIPHPLTDDAGFALVQCVGGERTQRKLFVAGALSCSPSACSGQLPSLLVWHRANIQDDVKTDHGTTSDIANLMTTSAAAIAFCSR